MLLKTQMTQISYILIESRIVRANIQQRTLRRKQLCDRRVFVCIKNAGHLPDLISHNTDSGLGVYGMNV